MFARIAFSRLPVKQTNAPVKKRVEDAITNAVFFENSFFVTGSTSPKKTETSVQPTEIKTPTF